MNFDDREKELDYKALKAILDVKKAFFGNKTTCPFCLLLEKLAKECDHCKKYNKQHEHDTFECIRGALGWAFSERESNLSEEQIKKLDDKATELAESVIANEDLFY